MYHKRERRFSAMFLCTFFSTCIGFFAIDFSPLIILAGSIFGAITSVYGLYTSVKTCSEPEVIEDIHVTPCVRVNLDIDKNTGLEVNPEITYSFNARKASNESFIVIEEPEDPLVTKLQQSRKFNL